MGSDETLKKYAIQGGVLYGAVASLFMLLLSVINTKDNVVITIASLVLSIGIVAWACTQFKKDNDSFLSLGEAMKIGLIIGAVGGLIYAVYMYLHYEFIFTNELAEMRELAYEELDQQVARGEIPNDEGLDMAKKAIGIFTSSFTLSTISLITQVVKAFIFGLGCGLIFRTNN